MSPSSPHRRRAWGSIRTKPVSSVHLRAGPGAKGDRRRGRRHNRRKEAGLPRGGSLPYAGIAGWVGIVPNDGLHPAGVVTEYVGDGKRCGLLALTNNRVYFNFAAGWEKVSPARSGLDRGRRAIVRGLAPHGSRPCSAHSKAASRSIWRSPTYPTSPAGVTGGRPLCWVMPPTRRRPLSARARARRSRMWSSSSAASSKGRPMWSTPCCSTSQSVGGGPSTSSPCAQGGRKAPREGRVDVWRVVPGDPSLVRAHQTILTIADWLFARSTRDHPGLAPTGCIEL